MISFQSDYTDSISILEKNKEDIPFEIWNNCGVLNYLLAIQTNDYFSKMKLFSESKKCFMRVLNGNKENNESFDIEQINFEIISNLSIAYNLARVYEEENEFQKATPIYEKILSVHPAYFDGKKKKKNY